MHELLISDTDLGPSFVGWSAQIAGRIVCVVTQRVQHDPEARRAVRELIKRQGGDCGACHACLIGEEA